MKDFHSAQLHGHKISTSTSDCYKPWGAWCLVHVSQLSAGPPRGLVGAAIPLSGTITLTKGWLDTASQGIGDQGVQWERGRGVLGHGRDTGGWSGTGGLLALHGDLAATAALAGLLVGGNLGCLDDQQPLW